jgi:hypothetical protein
MPGGLFFYPLNVFRKLALENIAPRSPARLAMVHFFASSRVSRRLEA